MGRGLEGPNHHRPKDEDSAVQAADALADVLEREPLQRLTQRLIDIQNTDKKED
jgi:hypothetical protein